ncbi:MAG: phosphate signaling complex protein PhoU [Bacillota bacterium]|jgi:phosphate transport system protein
MDRSSTGRTRGSFETQLGELREDLLKMGALVKESVHRSVKALKDQDIELAQSIVEGDETVDALEHEIEHKCLMLLALQQPMAVDLRFIGTALKAVTDLERMADHATDIAKIALRIGHEPHIKPLVDIPRMAALVEKMLDDGLRAFIARDAEAAVEVAGRDDEVDHLYGQVYRELLTYMLEDPRTIRQATHLLFAAQHLERIGDHVTNLSEWVLYLVRGELRDLNP